MKRGLPPIVPASACFLAACGQLAGADPTDAHTLPCPGDGADAVPILREAIRHCRENGIRKLELAPGIWNLHPERATGGHRHISNHDPGYRRSGIYLDGFDGFEIDGRGATLRAHGVLIPIVADRCRSLAIRDLTIEWSKPFHLEGAVTAVGEDWFEVEMLPECGVILRDGTLLGGMAELFFGELSDAEMARQDFRWNYWIDPGTRAAAAVQPKLSLWNRRTNSFAEIGETGPNRFRLRNAHANSLPLPGSVMICKGMNRQNRLSPAIHLSGVDGARVENVTVHHAGGMGIIAEDCTDPTVIGFKVALHPSGRSLVTTTADATHFVGCRGTVRVENCLFENMLDDSCNVHGIYAIAEELLAPDRLGVSFSHFEQLGTAFARPGDRLRLLKRDTLLGYAECGVRSVTRHNEDYYVLELDAPIDGLLQPMSSVENLSTRPDVIFRGNTARNNRARSILVTSGGKVSIEGNRFERPSMVGILVEGDNEFWYESGGVEDVTIRDNRFVGHSPDAPIFRFAPMQKPSAPSLPPYHRNIRILDNEIEAAGPCLVEARRVAGLEFSGNNVRFVGGEKGPAKPGFSFDACESITLRNNRFSRPTSIRTTNQQDAVLAEGNENLDPR